MTLTTSFNSEIPTAATPPAAVQLLPAGPEIVGRDGRSWAYDMQAEAAVLAAFLLRGKPLPLDWEHATELRAPKGKDAPAAGWITRLEARGGELWGDVEWTPRGAEQVVRREYRYLSPVFAYDPNTGRIVELLSAGLTNQPNLRMQALNKEERMDKILALLGLSADAAPEQVLAALNTLKAQADQAKALNVQAKAGMATLATALGLPESATADQAVAAINSLRTASLDLSRYVPRSDFDAAVQRATNAESKVAKIEQDAKAAAIAAVVDEAVKAGKVTPASKEFYIASCRQEGGLDAFKKFLESAPVIAAPQGVEGEPGGGKAKALNAEETAVFAQMGVTPEDLEKYGK